MENIIANQIQCAAAKRRLNIGLLSGRRIGCDKSGSAFTTPDTYAYLYNARGELTNATASVDAAYRYGYQFDDIGNREVSSERGTNSVYMTNALNQYHEVADFVPAYDDDGNQTLVKTSTGVWSVAYNAENRPIRWVNDGTVITMSYDRMGRRVTKNDQRFVYDGYLQIADSTGNSYIWDPTEPVATRPLMWKHGAEVCFYTHDGNKNVSEVTAANGEVAAHYEYAPFGAVSTRCGDLADANPWRFSCEYAEDDTAAAYYNFRHYEPGMGRWCTRDPIGERGAPCLYVILHNHIMYSVDIRGLSECVVDKMTVDPDGVGWKLEKYKYITHYHTIGFQNYANG